MTNAAEWAIRRSRLVAFSVGLLVLMGSLSYARLGQLEDPEFTIQTAVVVTHYPGAGAARVEQQVTDPLERYLQQLGEVESIDSYSRNDLSVIFVNVQERHTGQRLKQVWDELHRKAAQAAGELPDGVRGPFVDTEYGDVFGIVLALTGHGYSYAELDRIGDDLRRELLRVPGVANNGFLRSLVIAVVIVLLVLLFSMGLRTGLVIGAGVPLSILGTFIVMWGMGIDLHRVSLGALVIGLGMLVDNAIVVAELTVVKIQRGLSRLRAAREAVAETARPLLSATLIAAMAFSPIALTRTAVGEFTRSMFMVVAASLLISWLLAVYVTPLMAHRFLRAPVTGELRDPYDTAAYRVLRQSLSALLARRGQALGGIAAMFVVAVAAFSLVPRIFYPPAQRTQILVDYWLPEGTRVERVTEDVARIESNLRARKEVRGVTAFIGEGAPRFYLPMIPEWRNPAYAQLLVDVDARARDPFMAELYPWLLDHFPDAEPRVRPLALGMPVRYPVILRIQGPDRERLRTLAEDAQELLRADPRVRSVRNDWRQRTPQARIEVHQERARRANLSSAAINETLQSSLAGAPFGMLHERNKHIPVVWRFALEERIDPARLGTTGVWPEGGGPPVPLLQVARVDLVWDDVMIWRRNRERAISVQADLHPGATADQVTRDLFSALRRLPLPPGYRAEWDGEAVEATKAQANVLGPAPMVIGLMALILMAQFNSHRRALIILLTVPLGMIGVSAGMLLFRQPFGFMALLGVMSLSGMIIKNAIVMVKQIDLELDRGTDPREALLDASVSRARPVLLAALTTVLGLLPLAISGPFWAPMAIAIMSGLAAASALTLIVVPLLYSTLFHIRTS
jgi:multidrug efflux pump subunit AcrB